MKKTAFIRTQDHRVIAIPTHKAGGGPRFAEEELTPFDFNLVNTLKPSAMREVREFAKNAGTRLHKPGVMALR